MKKAMNKILAVLMAVAMLCAMAVPAFAAGETGTITINHAVDGQTYTIYKMFNLDSYTNNPPAYSYTVESKWADFFKSGAPGAGYITLDAANHPTWTAEETAANYEAFAKAALTWAQQNNIKATRSENANGTSVTFNGLDLGYYLVDSSLGALCSLNTTTPNATIDEKNEVPDIKKTIVDNGDETSDNSAQIGDIVSYKVTVSVKKGATNYKVCDTMTAGLTFDSNSVKVNNAILTDEIGTLSTTTSPYTFVLTFTDAYLQKNVDKKIEVTYTATINDKAASTDPQTNKVVLTYGNNNTTSKEEKTTTNVYKFDLVKVDGKTNKLLKDAEFKLYGSATGTDDEIKLVQTDKVGYAFRVATTAEIEAGNAVDAIVTKADKIITISGLAGKKYYLEETKAPDGYNALPKREEIDLTDGSKKVTEHEGNLWTEANGGVYIENNAGATLPSTGGMGTTLFYVIGGGLMIAAVVLLVTKKRMENK